MVKLWCVVLGRQGLFPIDIALKRTVYELQQRIKKDRPELITCFAAQLALYLATRNGAWLDDCNEDATALRRDSSIPAGVASMLTKETIMSPPRMLKECFQEAKMPELTSGQIHIFANLGEFETDLEERPRPVKRAKPVAQDDLAYLLETADTQSALPSPSLAGSAGANGEESAEAAFAGWDIDGRQESDCGTKKHP